MNNRFLTGTLFGIIFSLLGLNPAYGKSGLELLNEAMDNYFYAEFDQAVKNGKAAIPELEDKKNLETVYKVIGFSYIALQKEKEGVEYFKKVIRIDPSTELDPMEFSPKLMNAFNKAKESMSGKLVIVSNSNDADILIDKKNAGKTKGNIPVIIKAGVGSHEVQVIKKDFKVFRLTMVIKEDASVDVKAILEKILFAGDVVITPNISGGEVFVDGNLIKEALLIKDKPSTVKNLPSGKHALIIKKPDYHPLEKEFEIKEGVEITPVSADLLPMIGELEVLINKAGTEVFIDSVTKGKTEKDNDTLNIKDVTAGEHHIAAKLTGHAALELDLKVSPETKNKITLNMVKSNMILIKTDPEGADIFINGLLKGKSPLEYPGTDNELFTVKVNMVGYKDGNVIFEYTDPANNQIVLHLINVKAEEIFLKGVEAEGFFDEHFEKFIAMKSRETEKAMNNYFSKAVDYYKEAIAQDPFYSQAYVGMGRMYYKKILRIRTNKLFIESELTNTVNLALENLSKAIDLNNDSLAYARAVENQGNVIFHRGEIEVDFEKKIGLYNSSIEHFDKAVLSYKKAMEKPDFEILELERTYFNRAIVFEKIITNRKKKNMEVTEEHMEDACKAWQTYDYPDIVNPDDPFNPLLNPFREEAQKHMQASCDAAN